jgi:hypothetical protein
MRKYLQRVFAKYKLTTMKKYLKNISIWLIILSIWVNKYYNLSPYLALPKVNNFLDILISSTDVVVIILSSWFFVITFFYNYFQPHTKYFVQPTVSHLFALITLMISFLINPSYGLLLTIARIFLLINIIPKLLHESTQRFRVTLMIGLSLALLFDHFLLSSSLPVILLMVLSMKLGFWQKNLVYIYLIVNFAVSLFQITTGHSLGLVYLGEPIIDSNTLNIARENFFGANVLRGYGLTQHPALFGFVAVFGLLFGIKNKLATKDANVQMDNNFPSMEVAPYSSFKTNFQQKVLPIASSILSLSRISLMTFLFEWIVNTRKRFNVTQKILCLGAILGLFVYRFVTSDKYRILDYQTWADVTLAMTFKDMFFGLGYYPEFLFNFYEGLDIWQMQPTHNSILGIFTQFGVWGFLGLLGWLYYDLLKPYFDNKKKKEQ